jgi:hypothetical protein
VFDLLFSLLGCESSCDRGIDGNFLIFGRGGGSGCRRRRRLRFFQLDFRRLDGLIELLLMLSDKALFQCPQFFGMLLGDFFRGRRWGTAEFARGLLHRSLGSGFLFLYRLLARNLLVTYPSAELFLLKPASVIYKIDLQPGICSYV